MMKIMLTGGTGFIGSYVLRFLLEDKHQVNVLVRNSIKLNIANHPSLKIFEGNLNNLNVINNSLSGCDVVIHLAARVSAATDNPEEYFSSNFVGTENLLMASKQNKVKKFVFTSSLSAHSIIPDSLVSEESLRKPEKYFSKYAETKGKAEDLVINYGNKGLPYIIIYPQRMFGIGPLNDANGATKALRLYLKNKLPFLIDSGNQFASWSFVDDVASGIVSAATKDIFNQRYILGGENETLANVYKMADEICSKTHLKIKLKRSTALSLISMIVFASKLLGKNPIITKEWLNYVLESQKISSEKAMRELNYKITPLNTALKKTVNWLKTL
ncbi:MAG: NAD-dependent epimerase/dehydratase family protein [Ignavibacteriaceae bacterium]|nr:NAD-dependent epimerase/dehydratase family protein [Ignavibacteriaceae bacterium]